MSGGRTGEGRAVARGLACFGRVCAAERRETLRRRLPNSCNRPFLRRRPRGARRYARVRVGQPLTRQCVERRDAVAAVASLPEGEQRHIEQRVVVESGRRGGSQAAKLDYRVLEEGTPQGGQ